MVRRRRRSHFDTTCACYRGSGGAGANGDGEKVADKFASSGSKQCAQWTERDR